jgi:hypothetical protein
MPFIMNDRPPSRPFLTPWFSPGVEPVRDGVYLTAALYLGARSRNWQALRWSCKHRAWFYAGTKEHQYSDKPPVPLRGFAWRGLAREPKP